MHSMPSYRLVSTEITRYMDLLTRRLAVRGAALVLAAVASGGLMAQAEAPHTCDVFDGIDLRFAPRAVALAAVEREKIEGLVTRIYRADYCPFSGLNVQGHTDSSEGDVGAMRALSLARANYVARLFEARGISKKLVHVESKGDKQPVVLSPDSRNSRVEVFVFAGCRSRTCPFPADASGLRLPK
jgi:outer membrane protein OmpA-like peptidoglycan-associated protein